MMSTGEWLTLIGILIGGFVWISNKLEKINDSLAHAVSYKACADFRKNCPCAKDIDDLKEKMDN